MFVEKKTYLCSTNYPPWLGKTKARPRFRGLIFLSEMEEQNKQRVIVYIDGFNFYYGLKKAPWKKYYWLDIVKLMESFLRPNQELVAVKYFSARPTDVGKRKRQDAFFQANKENPKFKLILGKYLKNDTLLHGDYCLPNIMLDNWCFSGFIDVDQGGIGDKHMDLFWGIWSLGFNLKTNAYRDRFLDAYGRDAMEEEMLRLIAAIEVFG